MRKGCNVLKRALAVLFALVMIASGICFMRTDANKVYAAASSAKDSTEYNKEDGYFVKQYEEISTYKTAGTYPILDGTEYTDAQDWLFAGWYTTEECTTSIGTTESGAAWAKFVHIDVLSVKCQVENDIDADTDKTNMRLISTLDSLKYDTVGFKVRYNGGDELDFPVSKVFKRINASEINGNECGYSPVAFHETSEYFVTYSLLNIANKNFSKPFYIEPYWVTLDGTEVRGASRFARVEDRYLEIVNVPVRLHQDAEATEGSVTVNYNIIDSDETVIYEPYKVDDTIQYDNGTMFDVVTVAADNDAKTVTVTTTEQAEGVQAKGMLVNLRFQMIADVMPSTSTFEIASSDFNVSDFIFKNFPLTYSGGYDISWYTGYEDSDTFAIASAADLYGLAALSNGTAEGVDKAVNFANKTIYLASDITINEGNPLGSDRTEGTTDDWATTTPSYVWAPIGKTTSFAGVFDGQENTISGIYLSATAGNAGMFAQTTTTCTIQNISIKNSYMYSTAGYMGSVVGYSNQTKFLNIYSDAYVIGDGNTIGGIVGGVVGASQDKNISSCWFDGTVTGDTYCGGIVGRFRKGTSTISNCLVTGSVVATSTNATASVGGIVGGMPANDSPTLEISTSVSVGSVTGGNAGGVIGYRASTETAYATLTLTDIYTTHTKGIGTQSKSTLPGYATDTEKKKVDSSTLNGHIAYDTIEGFSFLSNTNMEGKWVIRETAEALKDGVPIPKVFADEWIDVAWYYENVAGDAALTISTAEELYGFSDISRVESFDGYTIQLANDIAVNTGKASSWVAGTTKPGRVWTPIGKATAFAGTFDGQRNTISGIYVNETTEKAGLFADTVEGCAIQDVKIKNSYIHSNAQYVGSIAGYTQKTVLTNIYSDAYVIGDGASTIGGIVGRVQNGTAGEISSCWFDGVVSGRQYCGGIVGRYNYGRMEISDILVSGTVESTTATGTMSVGGIVGAATTSGNTNLTISTSIAVGNVTGGDAGGIIGNRTTKEDNSQAAYLTLNDLYTTHASGIGAQTGTSSDTVGWTQDTINKNIASKTINGHNAYDTINGFSFFSRTNTDGKWVIRETAETLKDGVPVPKVFADEWIDVEWYYDNPSEDATHYSIATPKELLGFADIYNTGNVFNGKTINLADDIPLNPENMVTDYINGTSTQEPENTWTPGGNNTVDTQFAGTFDGHGHTISGIYTVSNSQYVGLFGVIANGSVVKDLRITDSYFYTSNTGNAIIGSVAGECRGTIDSVYCEAIVESAGDRVGGLAGMASGPKVDGVYGTATINNSWFNGNINLLNGATNSGGLVGLTMQGNVNVTSCLVTGSLNNATKKTDAGLIGYIGYAGSHDMVVEISNNIVALKENVANTNVGTVIGTIKNGDANYSRNYKIINTYVVAESFAGNSIISDNKEDDTAAVVGTALIKAEADLQGTKGYENTLLDFYVNEYDSGEWVARNGRIPVLKSFTDEEVEDLEGLSQTGWYNDDIDSYYLGTVSAFKAFRDYVNDGKTFSEKYVYLTDDMDLNPDWTAPATYTKDVEGTPTEWTSIGDSSCKFKGTFDGHGHTVRGIYIESESGYVGLFGQGQNCTITDVSIQNSYIKDSGTKNFVGSAIGYLNNGSISKVYSDAIVVCNGAQFGGIVGRLDGDASACWFAGEVVSSKTNITGVRAGGIVGSTHGNSNKNDNLEIDNCLNTGKVIYDVTDTSATTAIGIGGIFGGDNGAQNITISNCMNAGLITAGVKNGTGSIAGMISKSGSTYSITNCYTRDDVISNKSGDDKWRICGYTNNISESDATVTGCVAYKLEDFYGLGAYMLTNLDFVQNEDEIIWAARRGQVPAPATLVADSDKLTIGDLGKADTSWLDDDVNNGLSEDTPYIIDSVEELYGFAILSQADNFEGKYIKLGADIDVNPDELATLPWYTIGVAEDGLRFAGVFDGDNHTISGIYLKQSKDYLGLFAAIEENAVVKNLRLENSYIEQTGSGATGSIIGDCRGTVDNVYSDAIIITSANYAGGIVACANGFSYKSDEANEEARTARTISNCWYDGTINMKKQFCGGIIGGIVQGEWTLTNCVFTGNINSLYKGEGAYAYAGGICGDIAAPAHEYGLDDTTVTSDTPSKLVVNSCISTGTIKTAVYDKGAGAIVGRMRTTDSQISILEMTNVFASRDAGWSEVGSSASGATVEGAAVWTNSADRLVGFCTEKTVTGYYDGGSLNYSEDFVLREEGVPVPKTFEDMTNKVATIEVAELDELLCLSTMDTTWTTEAAVNNGLGHYVLRTTEVEYTDFTTYLGALKDNGFKAYIALPGDTSEGVVAHVDEDSANDGVYNVIYRRAAGEWIVNVLFIQNTNSVTLTISNGFDSLSPDLVPKATVEGTVSLSMLQLIGSGTDYYYGNSFVFKLPTGKFVIVDGGNNDDNTEDVADNGDFSGLVSYLKELQDDSTKPVEIQAWVVSHQHGDHFDVVREFVDNAEAIESLRVNALYINEPSREAMLCNPEEGDVMKTVRQQYRGIRMLQDIDGNPTKVYWCQTGQKYYFDGLTMDVIQSQEQIEVKNYGPYNALATITGKVDFNTASMNLLFAATNEKKVFITGDSNQVNMEYIKTAYGEDSKMLANINVYQVPHHGKNTSYKVNAEDNAFTDYLAGLVTENAITAGKFDVALFPCSLFYGIDNTDLTAFPAAGDANSHLINEKSTSAYHYGNGTVVIELGDVVQKVE